MNMHIVLNLAQMPKLWQVLHAPNTKQGNQIALKVEHTNMKQAFQTFNKKHLSSRNLLGGKLISLSIQHVLN